jgi:tetratricopeptide (TPR) repeat protein
VSDHSNIEIALKRATAAHRAGRLSEAAALYKEILTSQPGNVQVLHLAGIVHTRLGNFSEAVSLLERCVALAPGDSIAVNNLGLALYPVGRQDEAITSFERALELKPDNATAANNLGNAHFKLRQLVPAREAFERALVLKPDYPDARSNLGHCLVLEGKGEEAIRNFEIVLRREPNNAHAIEGLANAYKVLDRLDDVVVQRRRLVALNPRDPACHVELGVALQAADRHEEALECFDQALKIDPRCAGAHARIGQAKLEVGKEKEAAESFATALKLNPRSSFYWSLFVRQKKVARDDGAIEALERLLPDSRAMAADDQVHLHFALGKALADVGEHEGSFSHYIEGNRINRTRVKYDEADFLGRMDRAGTNYSASLERRLAGHGNPTATPIFILGMPRTGSTLVEQILAAHPKVLAVGETIALREAIRKIDAQEGSMFPDWLGALRPAQVDALGSEYIERLFRIARARAPSADLQTITRLTDKLPGNFLYLGLIHLALPNAAIIHTRRDPVETCLSCFRIFFESLNYTCDLGELGRYYRHYEALMRRWAELMPPGLVLDVDYEALVQDTEAEARRIVAHCGLEWDDACLSFHKVERAVRTASVAQVRQPIYATSLKTWRPDDETLKPLLDALKEH